jgi:8-hydroxy-5-deazaflavin:NADPH oxidoreductase
MAMHVGILGGTGPAGRGLGSRMAAAGIEVTLGSRDKARAEATAAELLAAWPGRELIVRGEENAGAAEAEVVILATPFEGALDTVRPLREPLEGKVVVSMVCALMRVGQGIQAIQLARGSFAGTLQAALPGAKISGAFHHLPAEDLGDLDEGLMADVLVCADDAEAKATTMALVESMEGLRPLDAGRLTQAQAIEAFTAVCITINIRYKARTYVRMGGV